MKFRKRIAIFAVLFILLALLCSCSGQKGKEPAQINSIEDLNGKK